MTLPCGLSATLSDPKGIRLELQGLAVEPTTALRAARVKFCALLPRALVAF